MSCQRINTAVRLSAILCLFFALGAVAQQPKTNVKTPGKETKTSEDKPAKTPAPAPPSTAAELLAKMTLQQKAAQLMLVTLEGSPSPNSADRSLLERYTPGGVIIPAAVRPTTVAEYVVSLRALPPESKTGIPFLIGTDLFALPRRGPQGLDSFLLPLPSLLSVAAANDEQVAAQLGKMMAAHLVKMGFNFHVGPSLELAPSLAEAEGSLHCLGSDPHFVADSGCAMLKGLNDAAIVAMPIGFPGGGQNRIGKAPAVLLTPAATIRAEDLLPFKKAVDQGAPMIHVGNTLVPLLDSEDRPASLSPIVMHDLLREEFKFKGVIVAGPVDSPDITAKTDPMQAAITAIQAGADMVLWTQAGQRVMRTVDGIVAAVGQKSLSESDLDAAVTRILEMKLHYGLRERPVPKTTETKSLFKKEEFPQEVYEIERKSITLVQNHGDVLPLTKAKSLPVGVTGVAGVEELRDALIKPLKAVVGQPIFTAKYGGDIYDFEMDRLTSGDGAIKTAVIVMSPEIKTRSQVELLHKLTGKGMRTVVVLIGYPKILPQLTDADAVILAYCEPAAMGPAMRAVADVILGRAPVGFTTKAADVHASVGKEQSFNLMDMVQTPPGRLPVSFDPPYTAGLSVPYDPSQAIKKVVWDFGDGAKAKTVQASHAYKAAGTYPVTVTITDLSGQSASHTLHAQVE